MAFVKRSIVEPLTEDERKGSRGCADLIASLEDPNPTARRWAARDLLSCPEALPALVARLRNEVDISVREVILTSIISLGDPASMAGLVECLRSEDPCLRNEAIEAMKQLPDEVAPIMGSLLSDPDPDLRIFSINILESLRHSQVETWLVEVIEKDPVVNVCGTAVDLLAEVGSSFSIGALERLRDRFPEEPYIQFAANLALKRIHDGR
ncbi:MAG: HEAT repeat domain-containing protein [Spirochaetota bacterium]